MNTLSRTVKVRMQHLADKHSIPHREFLAVDAMRCVQKCISGVIRDKDDFGLVILADKRYKTKGYARLLPLWMSDRLSLANSDLSTDLIVQMATLFFKNMAQP